MSGIICECNEAVKNLGVANCLDAFGRPQRITFVPLYKEDGTENYIDTTTAALDATYFNSLQYHTDTNSRFYPLPINLKNVEMPKADPVYQEFDDGTKKFVRFGARSMTALVPDIAPIYIGKINSKKCGKMGIYITSDTGNLGGTERTKGLLYPLALADNTLNTMWEFAGGSTLEMGKIAMEFDTSVLDEQFNWINNSDISISLTTQFKGKTDTNIAQLAANRGATTFTVDIYTDYGSTKTKIPVEGLVTADFALQNLTVPATIVITSATESTTVPGRYVFVIPTATVTIDLRLNLSTSTAAKPFADGTWNDVIIGLD